MQLNSSIEIAVKQARVFDTINNYGRRLEWDTLLRHAEVLDEDENVLPLSTPLVAGMSVRSYARWVSGGVVMKTRYTQCDFPAAMLEMEEGPWFFEYFRAKANLEETADGGTYWRGEYNFVCRPRALRWIIEPIVSWVFLRETKMRAEGMKKWLEKGI